MLTGYVVSTKFSMFSRLQEQYTYRDVQQFFPVFLTRIFKFFAIIEEKKNPKKITNWRVVFNIKQMRVEG